MLTDQDLEALATAGESDRVERKETISDTDRIRQAICAFANDLADHRQPGVVLIGLRDDGSCAGLPIDDNLLRRLAGLRDDGKIAPFPTMTVEKRSIRGCEVAAAIVAPSENPPVNVDGRVWIRVGPRRATATQAEESRLLEKRQWGVLPADAQPVRGAVLDELDLRRFQIEYLPSAVSPEVIEENQRTVEEQLKAHRFLFRDSTPTRAGLLIAGIDPRRWIPGAYVQFRRVAGEDLADDTIDQEEIGGTILDQVRRTEEILDINILKPLALRDDRHEVHPTYPLGAVQQVVRNALLHRTYDASNAPVRVTWYDDRLEIQNPGGPYGNVTAENFGRPGVTDYRNPTLANAMKELGLIERFGAGMGIIRRRLQKNENPDAEFTVEPNYVLVTLRPRP